MSSFIYLIYQALFFAHCRFPSFLLLLSFILYFIDLGCFQIIFLSSMMELAIYLKM